jgi:4a-hydroxytetrahydrobiopterin dehydratase
MQKLTQSQIDEALPGVPEWSQVGEAIQRTFDMGDFLRAMEFVNAVAKAAEAAQHHPDILVRYKRVTLTLATHDANGITLKDFDLARKIDALAPHAPSTTMVMTPVAVKKGRRKG